MKNEFAERLKEARIKKGLSQRDVERETGINYSTLSNFETGRRETNLENLKKLADFYEISIDWLLGREEKEKGSN